MGMFDKYNIVDNTVQPDNRIAFLNINEYDNITLGATSTHYFRLPVEGGEIEEYKVSYKQGLSVVLEKQTEECIIEEYEGGYYLKVIVSPENSRLFNAYNKDTFVQLALKLTDGTVSYSDMFRLAMIDSINKDAFGESSEETGESSEDGEESGEGY
jgi:hypothetical protein